MQATGLLKQTERLMRVMMRGNVVAARSKRINVDLPDLALALSESSGVAAHALKKQGVSLRQLRRRVIARFGFRPESVATESVLVVLAKFFSSWLGRRAADCEPAEPSASVLQALAMAAIEAEALSHLYVGTEHLLLGLLQSGGDVADFLNGEGICYENTRKVVRQLLRHPDQEKSTQS